ncbi:hypothetical protein COCNU_02G012320 [Cocos nucifera]|uniref:Uncharacterized protein n=1 Tax=Cocos nucifera TaxID=13894 RepID=A0A8K0MXK5_COCNU|nr:hypothetical protein COCNU_02G012320 [Cocos nucifera]
MAAVPSILEMDGCRSSEIGLLRRGEYWTIQKLGILTSPYTAALLSVDGIEINEVNRVGETALSVIQKSSDAKVDAVAAKGHSNPPNAAKQPKAILDMKSNFNFFQPVKLK